MDGTTLKLIALVLMTIDHIGELIPGTPIVCNYIGRLSASIFFFCAVQGYLHTRSKKQYLVRLYLCAQLMTVIDILLPLLMHACGKTESFSVISNNVFLEIFGMLFLIDLLERVPKKCWSRTLVMIGYFAWQFLVSSLTNQIWNGTSEIPLTIVRSLAGVFCDRGLYVDLVILIFYLFRGSRKKQALAYGLWCGLYIIYFVLCIPGRWNHLIEPVLGLHFYRFGTLYSRAFETDYQWMMVFSLPLYLLYNGKRGKGLKKLFYVYYPAHIALLYIIGCLL